MTYIVGTDAVVCAFVIADFGKIPSLCVRITGRFSLGSYFNLNNS